jgi:hypothetical protein
VIGTLTRAYDNSMTYPRDQMGRREPPLIEPLCHRIPTPNAADDTYGLAEASLGIAGIFGMAAAPQIPPPQRIAIKFEAWSHDRSVLI